MVMREITIHLPEALLEQMSVAANGDQVSLDNLVQSALEQYLEEDLEETPDEKILADFREAWREVMRGEEGIPAREALADIRRERHQSGN